MQLCTLWKGKTLKILAKKFLHINMSQNEIKQDLKNVGERSMWKNYKIFWKINNLKKKVMVSPKVVNWQWYEPSNDMSIFAFIYYRCAATLLLILSLPYSPTDWLTHLMILKILLQTFRWLWHWHGLQIRRGKILKAWPWHFPQYYFKNAPC